MQHRSPLPFIKGGWLGPSKNGVTWGDSKNFARKGGITMKRGGEGVDVEMGGEWGVATFLLL